MFATESFEWEKHRLLDTCRNSNTLDGDFESGAVWILVMSKYGRCLDTVHAAQKEVLFK